MSIIDNDFIGFTFNGKHNINDLHIYRVSNGDRYDETSNRSLRDQTVDLSGQDGGLWLDNFYKAKHFKISFAYDNLKKEDIEQIKSTFDGKEVYPLIFDEYPYKFYKAKVENKVTLQYICFEENGEDVYKGEGQINFICYDPYGYSPIFIKKEENLKKNWNAGQTYEIECGFWLPKGTLYLQIGETKLQNFEIVLNDSKKSTSNINLELSEISFVHKILVSTKEPISNSTLKVVLNGEIIGKVYSNETSDDLRLYPDYNLSAAAIPIKIIGENLQNGDKISIADMWCVLDEDCGKCCWDTDTGAVYDLEKNKMIKTHGRLSGVVKVGDSLQPVLQKKSETSTGKISLQYQLRYY